MPDNSTMHAILDAPNLGQLEKEALVRCIDSNYVSTFGPFVSEFEDKLSNSSVHVPRSRCRAAPTDFTLHS